MEPMKREKCQKEKKNEKAFDDYCSFIALVIIENFNVLIIILILRIGGYFRF